MNIMKHRASFSIYSTNYRPVWIRRSESFWFGDDTPHLAWTVYIYNNKTGGYIDIREFETIRDAVKAAYRLARLGA